MGSDENNEQASINVEILAHVRSHMFGVRTKMSIGWSEDISVPGTTVI